MSEYEPRQGERTPDRALLHYGDGERKQRICRFLHRSERFRRELGRQAGFSFAVKVRIGRADTTT